MGYLVKWKSYGEEHNSWVDERDAGYVACCSSIPLCSLTHAAFSNAHDLIDEYWARNKKPNARSGRKSTTGRPSAGRQSSGAAATARKSVPRESSSEVEEVRPKKRGRPPKAKKDESVDGSADEVEEVTRAKKPKKSVGKASRDAPTEDAEGFTSMKQWKNEDTWDHLVDTIDTVERGDDGDLMIYFTLYALALTQPHLFLTPSFLYPEKTGPDARKTPGSARLRWQIRCA